MMILEQWKELVKGNVVILYGVDSKQNMLSIPGKLFKKGLPVEIRDGKLYCNGEEGIHQVEGYGRFTPSPEATCG